MSRWNLKLLSIAPISLLSIVPIALSGSCSNDKKGNSKKIVDPLDKSNSSTNFIKSVSTDEAQEIIAKNKNNDDFVLLDVRTQGELDEQYIDGMINIDYRNPDFKRLINQLNKKKTFLVYCRTQNRSHAAANIMKELGFEKVYWMDGGITKWLHENKPVINVNAHKKTLSISSNKNTFLISDDVEFLVNLDGSNITESEFTFELKDENDNLIAKDSKVFQNKFSTSLKSIFGEGLTLQENKQYSLWIKCEKLTNTNDALFKFSISKSPSTNPEFEAYKSKGAYDHISKHPSLEVNEDFIRNNFGHNVFQYKATNIQKEEKTIDNLVDKEKNTIVLFASPTCSSCMNCLVTLSKFDLSKFNYVKILTSVSDNVDEFLSLSKESFKEMNISSELDNSLLDNKDLIWKTKFNFSTTPKMLLVNKFGNVVNAIDSLSENNFEQDFIDVLDKTFDIKITKKLNIEPNENDSENEGKVNNQEESIFKNEYRTLEQRKKTEKDKIQYLKERDWNAMDKLYGLNVSEFRVYKSNGDLVPLKEVLPKNDNPTVLMYGSTHCGYCAYALKFFHNNPLKYANFIDLLTDGGINWFAQNNSSIDKIDKEIFQPYKSDWNVNVFNKYSHSVPQGYVLDKEYNLTYAFGSNYFLAQTIVDVVKDTISTLDENKTK
ncbi:rhodanese-like domain-containing protein [Mycoplasma sp. Mirounga ES2805-ORL]|uniref:rhodanese-like domain-containing protein n=1 Tax=Mycoplasma sp. Mirounga ES2805-ORL TaxID=754514 RepID=UPI00197C684A|nr:rhodanese-like domain-containing protein [Mycoplasma sp. Mirounga ES2805-ORL]QSF13423.1 rhodanese-like domain-containing protein [Mycoplasma sp. Mirounga ES2805-ORL]